MLVSIVRWILKLVDIDVVLNGLMLTVVISLAGKEVFRHSVQLLKEDGQHAHAKVTTAGSKVGIK